jgi:tetratricopeptide (TPR) repeat protein
VVTLATVLQDRVLEWSDRSSGDNLFKIAFGEGRRVFAGYFFTKADVYFHSGYYPSIFDRAAKAAVKSDTRHLTESGEDHSNCTHAEGEAHDHDHDQDHAEGETHEDAHMKAMAFLGEPTDWVEKFGRRFRITEHTHLEDGAEREILPWLRLSASLDPQRIETYTAAGFWLRTRMGKAKEAEQFLREGLRENPHSYEILFELGRLYLDNDNEPDKARNVWELGIRRWQETQLNAKEPDNAGLQQLAVYLAALHERQNRLTEAIRCLELAKAVAVDPEVIQKNIDDLKAKLAK